MRSATPQDSVKRQPEMAEALAYYNGHFIPQASAQLPVHDAGFVFGATVTDLCRTFRHRLYRLHDHLARFRRSCEAAYIPQPRSDEELAAAAEELTARNAGLLPPEQELVLVLLATPGPLGYYVGLPGRGPATLLMHTYPLPYARYAPWLREGVRLIVPAVRQVPPSCVAPHVKQRSRLHWWLGEQEAERLEDGAHALLLNQEGQITETAFANFLIVHGGTVISPPRADILDGISLGVTEELCRELGIPFTEAPIALEECCTADEAFLTGTAFCLAGVRSVNGMSLPWPGPVTEALAAAWERLVGLDYRAQILAGQ